MVTALGTAGRRRASASRWSSSLRVSTYSEVADLLGLSVNTVRSLYEKLRVCSKAEAVARAMNWACCAEGETRRRRGSESVRRGQHGEARQAPSPKRRRAAKLGEEAEARRRPGSSRRGRSGEQPRSRREPEQAGAEIPPVLAPVADAFADVAA